MKNSSIIETDKPKIQEFLNDFQNSRSFYDEKLVRAKEIIDEILMITSGTFERTDNYHDWSHELFIELFTILSTRHENFNIADFCHDLMTFVFSQSLSGYEVELNWRKQIYQKRGLDSEGIFSIL